MQAEEEENRWCYREFGSLHKSRMFSALAKMLRDRAKRCTSRQKRTRRFLHGCISATGKLLSTPVSCTRWFRSVPFRKRALENHLSRQGGLGGRVALVALGSVQAGGTGVDAPRWMAVWKVERADHDTDVSANRDERAIKGIGVTKETRVRDSLSVGP